MEICEVKQWVFFLIAAQNYLTCENTEVMLNSDSEDNFHIHDKSSTTNCDVGDSDNEDDSDSEDSFHVHYKSSTTSCDVGDSDSDNEDESSSVSSDNDCHILIPSMQKAKSRSKKVGAHLSTK
jgi:hypothetical protein